MKEIARSICLGSLTEHRGPKRIDSQFTKTGVHPLLSGIVSMIEAPRLASHASGEAASSRADGGAPGPRQPVWTGSQPGASVQRHTARGGTVIVGGREPVIIRSMTRAKLRPTDRWHARSAGEMSGMKGRVVDQQSFCRGGGIQVLIGRDQHLLSRANRLRAAKLGRGLSDSLHPVKRLEVSGRRRSRLPGPWTAR